MKKIELVKSDKVDKTIEVPDDQFPAMMKRVRLRAELLSRDSKDKWTAREYREPVIEKPPKEEEIYEAQVKEKEKEILRQLAIAELEAVKEK